MNFKIEMNVFCSNGGFITNYWKMDVFAKNRRTTRRWPKIRKVEDPIMCTRSARRYSFNIFFSNSIDRQIFLRKFAEESVQRNEGKQSSWVNEGGRWQNIICLTRKPCSVLKKTRLRASSANQRKSERALCSLDNKIRTKINQQSNIANNLASVTFNFVQSLPPIYPHPTHFSVFQRMVELTQRRRESKPECRLRREDLKTFHAALKQKSCLSLADFDKKFSFISVIIT